MPRNGGSNQLNGIRQQLKSIQHEIQPLARITGGTAFAGTTPTPSVRIHRKIILTETASSNVFKFTGAGLPAGCKVKNVTLINTSGRSLILTVPASSGLFLPGSVGQAMSSRTFAPLSRFPKLKLQIPDLLAAPITSTSALFEGRCDGASDNIQAFVTYSIVVL